MERSNAYRASLFYQADPFKQLLPASYLVNALAPELVFSQRLPGKGVASDGNRTRDRQVLSLMLFPLSYFNRCRF